MFCIDLVPQSGPQNVPWAAEMSRCLGVLPPATPPPAKLMFSDHEETEIKVRPRSVKKNVFMFTVFLTERVHLNEDVAPRWDVFGLTDGWSQDARGDREGPCLLQSHIVGAFNWNRTGSIPAYMSRWMYVQSPMKSECNTLMLMLV